MKTILGGFLFVLFVAGSASADEYHFETRLLCTDYSAILQVARAYNEQPVFGELPVAYAEDFATAEEVAGSECEFGSENRPHPLRIKVGTIPGRHFGECGGVTKHFFSMWIGQRRILSRRMLDNFCSPFENLELVYYSGGTLAFCTRPYDSFPGLFVLETDAPDFVCIDVSHIFADAIRGPVDEIEYPPDGTPRREGHVILLRSENAELCAYLHTEFRAGRHFYDVFNRYHDETGTEPLESPLGPLGSVGPFSIDINNDGLPDVLAVAHHGPGSIGEELILLADGREGRDISTFPDPFGLREVAEFPTLIPVGETVFAEGLHENNEPYALLRPFDWHGTTFVLYSSVFDNRPPEWAIYMVNPDNSFSEICVLDRVPIHY
jgi:hypothetical protein